MMTYDCFDFREAREKDVFFNIPEWAKAEKLEQTAPQKKLWERK